MSQLLCRYTPGRLRALLNRIQSSIFALQKMQRYKLCRRRANGFDFGAGPVGSMQVVGLAVCLDAVDTTATVAAGDLQRLHDRLAAMSLLTNLDSAVRQVRKPAADPPFD